MFQNSKMSNIPSILSKTISCKQGAVRAVRFNVDGNYCITCGGDKTVKLWNPHRGDNGLLLKTYSGHGYEVLDACGSCDNAQIVSAGLDKQIFVWDVATGKISRKFRGHVASINSVAINEESTVVFSASLDGTVRAWDMKSKSNDPIQILDEATDSVTTVNVSDHEVLSGSADCRVRRYDLRQGQMYLDFLGKSVTSVNFTKDGQCLLISTLDSTIRLLDKDTGELLAEFTGHKNHEYKIDSCLLSSDTHVVSGSEDAKLYIWDLVEGKLVSTLDHPVSKPVHSLSTHPTQNILLTACMDKVYVWKNADVDNE